MDDGKWLMDALPPALLRLVAVEFFPRLFGSPFLEFPTPAICVGGACPKTKDGARLFTRLNGETIELDTKDVFFELFLSHWVYCFI